MIDRESSILSRLRLAKRAYNVGNWNLFDEAVVEMVPSVFLINLVIVLKVFDVGRVVTSVGTPGVKHDPVKLVYKLALLEVLGFQLPTFICDHGFNFFLGHLWETILLFSLFLLF